MTTTKTPAAATKPYATVRIDGALVGVTRDELDQRILQALAQHVQYGASTSTVASKATGGHATTPRRFYSGEPMTNYGRVRRRLQALFDAGKVRRSHRIPTEWCTNDADVIAADARETADRETRAAEVKRVAMSLGLLRDESPVPEDDPDGCRLEDICHANNEKLGYGFSIELTNEEFLTLVRLAGLTTMKAL